MLTDSDSVRTSVLCNLYVKQHCFSTDRSLCDFRAFLEKKDITIACGGLTPKIGKFGRYMAYSVESLCLQGFPFSWSFSGGSVVWVSRC